MDLRLIPMLALLYLLSFLDRGNIGNAKIEGLQEDLKMTPDQYNWCLTIFFFTYAAFEVPSNLLLKKLRPSRWLPLIMVAWGTVMTLMGLVRNYHGLLAARLCLGIAEAGLFPGVAYYLTMWYVGWGRGRDRGWWGVMLTDGLQVLPKRDPVPTGALLLRGEYRGSLQRAVGVWHQQDGRRRRFGGVEVDLHTRGHRHGDCGAVGVLCAARLSRDGDVLDRGGEGVRGVPIEVPGAGEGRFRTTGGAGGGVQVEVCHPGLYGLADMGEPICVLGGKSSSLDRFEKAWLIGPDRLPSVWHQSVLADHHQDPRLPVRPGSAHDRAHLHNGGHPRCCLRLFFGQGRQAKPVHHRLPADDAGRLLHVRPPPTLPLCTVIITNQV